MNILESFANYLQGLGIATLGSDLFIGEAPAGNRPHDAVWWIVASGGSPEGPDFNRWKRVHFFDIYYRDRSSKCLFDNFEKLRDCLCKDPCKQLECFDVVDIEITNEVTDNDRDIEDRHFGVMTLKVTLYKCNKKETK